MSKGVKKVIGIVAMIMVPFAAPLVAAAIGVSSTIGVALVGAGMGAVAAGVTGGDPLTGALLGGVGTWAVGGFDPLFGAGTTVAGAGGTSVSPFTNTGAAETAVVAAAPLTFGQTLLQGVTDPKTLARLAMTVFGKQPQDLTAIEQERLVELQRQAATNQGLFDTQVSAARSLMQQGTPNPEGAFASAQIGLNRQMEEEQRLMGTSGQRKYARRAAAIEGAKVGTGAVAAENARAASVFAAGAGMLPAMAPDGAAGLSMELYNDLQKRRDAYYADLAGVAGGMFGTTDTEDTEDA